MDKNEKKLLIISSAIIFLLALTLWALLHFGQVPFDEGQEYLLKGKAITIRG